MSKGCPGCPGMDKPGCEHPMCGWQIADKARKAEEAKALKRKQAGRS